MKQYLELLKEIQKRGVHKPPARAGMPGSQSLFGYQFRHDLQEGFPLLTTKKIYWKAVVVELLWFLRGDTNIKYLVDNGVNIWNEDAYNYYLKKIKDHPDTEILSFDRFIEEIKKLGPNERIGFLDFAYGDCGFQYGKVWRDWPRYTQRLMRYYDQSGNDDNVEQWMEDDYDYPNIDQIANLIHGLKNNPESRRHIVTAIDPAHDQDLALYWCHAMFQFNCRPLSLEQRFEIAQEKGVVSYHSNPELLEKDYKDIPKYYLDCQLYQRSADAVLGVPFNIASYALLTHILCRICNMIPGEFIHSFGDVHIYHNHKDAVKEQLTRFPSILPELVIEDVTKADPVWIQLDDYFQLLGPEHFKLEGYNPKPAIKAELSTGLIK